jgi:CHASE3 domain sensor protein
MTRRAPRLAIWLLLAAVVGAAGYFLFDQHHRSEAARAHLRTVEDLAARMRAGLAIARTGQHAYVAPGQSETWWRARVGTALDTLHGEIEDLRQLAADPAALNDLDAAAAAIERLAAIDGQARRAIGFGETTRAATLVFGDGLQAAADAERRLESAVTAERSADERRRTEQRAREAGIALGAGLLALLASLTLALTGPARAVGPPNAEVQPAEVPAADPAAPVAVAAAPPTAEALSSGGTTAADGTSADWSVSRDRRKAPELRAAADLCTDFARLGGEQELPALLERTATLIDAAGIIIWVAAPGTGVLTPLLAHGYTQQALSRLPAITASADNATAAAFRNAELEVVKTNGMSPGALAVPLMTSTGCVGVMAAEVRHGREASESARALARIVAAQFATLVGPAAAQEPAAPAVAAASQAAG